MHFSCGACPHDCGACQGSNHLIVLSEYNWLSSASNRTLYFAGQGSQSAELSREQSGFGSGARDQILGLTLKRAILMFTLNILNG